MYIQGIGVLHIYRVSYYLQGFGEDYIYRVFVCFIFTWYMRVSYLQGIRVNHIIYSVFHIYRVLSCVILFTGYRWCGLYSQGICMCVSYIQGISVCHIYRV